MRWHQWFTVGLLVGVAVSAVSYLLTSEEAKAAVKRAANAGDRMGEGVAEVMEQVNGGAERMAAAVGRSAHNTSDEARAQVDAVGRSVRRTVRDVGRALTSKA